MLDAIKVITAFTETIKIVQTEETKRARIAVQRDVLIQALCNECKFILAYFALRRS
ncbi:hypothetical protein [Chloroflexus sp.]|uniref:hypothetical protein n=1 Tax=Chloroflexus sp. TaxID=1904827 RepID=UPI002ADE3572|nr:hypothetical protein [Chloroflexus sp.]